MLIRRKVAILMRIKMSEIDVPSVGNKIGVPVIGHETVAAEGKREFTPD